MVWECATAASCRRFPACISTIPFRPPVGSARGRQSVQTAAAGFRVRAVLRRAAQLSALRLAGAVPVRHIARGVEEFLRGTRNHLAQARRGYFLRALRHLAAHERHRLPQQESSDGERVGQQPGEYVRDLSRAIGTPYPPYEKLGVKVDGEYRQLNANILQIENEYYSYIRPKRVRAPASVPPRRCSGPAWNTSKCARST
jgi:hypothetical protein